MTTINEWFVLWVKCKCHLFYNIELFFWEHIKTISVTTVGEVGLRKTKNSLIVMN